MPYTYDSKAKTRVDFNSIIQALNEQPDVFSSDSTFRVVAAEDTKMQLKMHTGIRSFMPGSAAERTRREQAAVDVIKLGIDNQLGPGAGAEVFRQAGVTQGKISGRQLVAMVEVFNNYSQTLQAELVKTDRPNVQQWSDAAANPQPGAPKALTGELQDLLRDPEIKWKVSDSGMGGALIGVKANGQGVVVKIEDSQATEKAALLSNLMRQALPQGSGAFEVARVTDETQNHAALVALREKLDQLSTQFAAEPDMAAVLESHKKMLSPRPDKPLGLTKMEFVAGTQLNKLTLDDRAAMLQSGVLARELGKAAAICPVMGLSDHASPTASRLPTNLSNFMMDPATGKLAPIDFDIKPSNNRPGTFRADDAVNGVEQLTTYLTNSTASQQAFDEAVERLVHDAVEGLDQTPLCSCLIGLTQPNGSIEGLFSPKEGDAVRALVRDGALQRQLAVDLIKGAAEGLQCIKANQATISQAMATTEHVLDGIETARVAALLNPVDFQAMRQNLDSLARNEGVAVPAVAQDNLNAVVPAVQAAGWAAPVRPQQEARPPRENVRGALLGANRQRAGSEEANVALPQPPAPELETPALNGAEGPIHQAAQSQDQPKPDAVGKTRVAKLREQFEPAEQKGPGAGNGLRK